MSARNRASLKAKSRSQSGMCFYCPTPLNFRTPSHSNPNGATRDHLIPKCKGVPTRIVASCWWCNHYKMDMSEAEFRSKLPLLLKKHGRKIS